MVSTGMLAASYQEFSFPLSGQEPKDPGDLKSENIGLPVEVCLACKHVAQSSCLCFSLACEGNCFFLLLFMPPLPQKNKNQKKQMFSQASFSSNQLYIY